MNKKKAMLEVDKYRDKELLPCPFCADKENPPYLSYIDHKHKVDVNFTVSCTNCGCEPDFFVETPLEAIRKWNQRKKIPDQHASTLGYEKAREDIIKLIQEMK